MAVHLKLQGAFVLMECLICLAQEEPQSNYQKSWG